MNILWKYLFCVQVAEADTKQNSFTKKSNTHLKAWEINFLNIYAVSHKNMYQP